MKRLGNNFDEWEREANYLEAMGKIDIRSKKGLDDQSHLYKNLAKDDSMTMLDVALTIVFFILPLCFAVFLFLSF
jgi:hypothetical protein